MLHRRLRRRARLLLTGRLAARRAGEDQRERDGGAGDPEPRSHSGSSNQKKPTVPGPACVPTTAPSVVVDVDLRLRPQVGHERAHRLLPLGRVRVRDADVQVRRVARALRERARELLHRLLVAANALDRQHLAVLDREDRLDVEQVAGERGGLADAPALLQELERVDREDQTRIALEALDELVDLVVGRAALEPPLNREAEHRDRRRRGLGVDDAHLVAELRRRRARAFERAGQLRGELQRVDPLVSGELLVGGEEIAGRRLRRRRQLGHSAQPRVELLRPDLDVVAPALVAEADVQRHHAPVREPLARLRESRRSSRGRSPCWRQSGSRSCCLVNRRR